MFSKTIKMEKITGLKLADIMTDYVNAFSRDKGKEFIEGFTRQHRTLQQSSFRVILELIEYMATNDYQTDLRNESSKKIAEKLMAGFRKVTYEEEIAMGSSPETAKEVSESENFIPSRFLPFI